MLEEAQLSSLKQVPNNRRSKKQNSRSNHHPLLATPHHKTPVKQHGICQSAVEAVNITFQLHKRRENARIGDKQHVFGIECAESGLSDKQLIEEDVVCVDDIGGSEREHADGEDEEDRVEGFVSPHENEAADAEEDAEDSVEECFHLQTNCEGRVRR